MSKRTQVELLVSRLGVDYFINYRQNISKLKVLTQYMIRFHSIAFFLLVFSLSLGAQDFVLSGKVIDAENNEPLAFATISVSIDGKTSGSQSDLEGKYELKLPYGDHTLSVTYVGYQTHEMVLSNSDQRFLLKDIAMEPAANIIQELVVTGSKFEKPLSEVTVSMEVLKANLIENSNTVQIDQGLKKVPGVNIIDGQANIRGGSGFSYGAGSRVLLMVDEMPYQQADAGFPNWDFVPVENIKQVEVIKGAASALYGSSALNGIVNIRTNYATNTSHTSLSTFGTLYQNPSSDYDLWYGNDLPNEQGLSFAHRSKLGDRLGLVAGGYFFRQDNWRKTEYRKRGRVNLNFNYKVSDVLNIGVNSNVQISDNATLLLWNGLDSLMYEPFSLNGTESGTNTESTKIAIDPFVNLQLKDNARLRFQGRFYSTDNRASNGQSNQAKNYYGELQYRKQFSEYLTLTTGLVRSSVDASAELFGNARYEGLNAAYYIQGDAKVLNKLNLNLGMRYEYFELSDPEKTDTGDKIVGRFGLNYQVAEFSFLRGSFGQGFRYPTIAERYISTSVGAFNIIANPALESEDGWSAELGLKQGLALSKWKGYIDVSVFINQYENMTEFVFGAYDGSIGFRSENVGDTDIRGIELTLAGQGKLGNSPTQVLAGYTYIDPTFQDFTQEINNLSSADYNVLKYRFKHSAKFDIESKVNDGPFYMGLAMNYTSNMEAIDKAFLGFIPGLEQWREENNTGNAIFDARIRYDINEQFSISTLVKNLTNRQYTLRPALIEAPRNYTLKLNYKF